MPEVQQIIQTWASQGYSIVLQGKLKTNPSRLKTKKDKPYMYLFKCTNYKRDY